MGEDDPSDEKKAEDSEEGGKARKSIPVGRRVVRKKRRSRGATRETLTLKKRQIASELIESTDASPVNVREQVERLRRAQKEQKEANKEVMEERWGDRDHRRRGSRWLILAVFSVVIPVLALVVALSLGGGGGQDAGPGESLLNLDEEEPLETFDATDPVTWFHENSVEAFEDAKEILEEINEGETAEAAISLMRNPEQTRSRIRDTNFEWSADFVTTDPRQISWQYGASGKTGWLAVMGRDTDFRMYRAYFVKTGQGLRLDWDATTAYSQIAVSSLVDAAPQAPVVLRCWLAKKPSFDYSGEGPNALLSWYQVLDVSKEHYVWAYTTEGSELDVQLKELFSYGNIVMKLGEDQRAMISLRAGRGDRKPNEFELVELIAPDWVQP